MIWDSTALMTVCDLVILGLVGFSLRSRFGQRRSMSLAEQRGGAVFVGAGLGLISLPYLLDLIAMWLAPLFVSRSITMAFMRDLHLNYVWWTTIAGTLCFAIGLTLARRAASSVVDRLRESVAALRESEDRWRQLADAASEAVVIDEDGVILDVNDACLRYLRCQRAEVVGHELLDFFGTDSRGFVRDKLTAVIEEPFEVDALRPDGTVFPVRIRSRPLSYEGRTVRVTIVRDLSEAIETAEVLRSTEAQLRHAQKMEAVGRLAAGVAHDFNNLLTIIGGNGQMARLDLSDEDPVRPMLDEIVSASESAASLTGQLLAFSRKQVLRPKILDLNRVIDDVSKMLRRLLGEDIHLSVVNGVALGAVSADPGQLEQVIVNLAVNAQDAMPRGGQLTLSTCNVTLDEAYAREHAGSRPGDYVMLAVSDTGTGIPSDKQSLVFEPFYTTKSEGKGTGLGLSTTYGIVKQSGGYIELYSEPGQGTAFKIYLPRQEDGLASAASEITVVAEMMGGTETILLAEDSDGVREVARRVLDGQGYTVLEARNAEEAEMLSERYSGHIHLLVTDVVMPGASGRELASQIHGVRPETKVLFMSGYAGDAVAAHGILESGSMFLSKPFSPESLLQKVHSALNGSPSA